MKRTIEPSVLLETINEYKDNRMATLAVQEATPHAFHLPTVKGYLDKELERLTKKQSYLQNRFKTLVGHDLTVCLLNLIETSLILNRREDLKTLHEERDDEDVDISRAY